MQGAADVSAEPNPVLEGQDITIRADGATEVTVSVDSGPDIKLTIDPTTGIGKFTAPTGARLIFIEIAGDPPTGTIVEVTSNNSTSSQS